MLESRLHSMDSICRCPGPAIHNDSPCLHHHNDDLPVMPGSLQCFMANMIFPISYIDSFYREQMLTEASRIPLEASLFSLELQNWPKNCCHTECWHHKTAAIVIQNDGAPLQTCFPYTATCIRVTLWIQAGCQTGDLVVRVTTCAQEPVVACTCRLPSPPQAHYYIIIIIPREGVGGALGATARKLSLLIPIWRSPQRNLAESKGKFPHTGMVLRL